jgi:hypothetical protein
MSLSLKQIEQMDYFLEENTKKNYTPAASFSSEQDNETGNSLSLSPPPLQFAGGTGGGSSSKSTAKHDWAEDYERLKNDDISPINESTVLSSGKMAQFYFDGYKVFKNKETYQPWFIRKESDPVSQVHPYTQGYRDEINKQPAVGGGKYIDFTGIKMKILSEGSPITLDNGGTVGVNGNKMGFDFNITNGDFAIKTDLLPVGEIAGNIFKFPGCGLEAKFKPQIGFLTVDPSDWSFEIELTIPGAPLSPAIIIGGKLNQPLIQSDWENLITREFFPFIGEIIDALEQ